MQKLEIDQTKSTPFVNLNPDTGLLEIGGESYPENSKEFFDPVLEWIEQFLSSEDTEVTLRVTLSYMNTSSTKYIIEILDRLEQANEKGRPVTIEWYCDGDNDRELDTVEELKEDFSMPFEVKIREA
ncbi:MAG: DUF1987 domain-containing protein [Spirochaetales bacterium]|nr:DUF1987 domain-containing protein [Spirochaetales bacterium]MCF7936965.1 DUF1987 domain-containing protein [Spirochaetales bacterium]